MDGCLVTDALTGGKTFWAFGSGTAMRRPRSNGLSTQSSRSPSTTKP
ncbi:hypothetical protein [Kribbella sp. NPDC003557]